MTTLEEKCTSIKKNLRSRTKYYSGKLTFDLTSSMQPLPCKSKQSQDKKNLYKNGKHLSENS